MENITGLLALCPLLLCKNACIARYMHTMRLENDKNLRDLGIYSALLHLRPSGRPFYPIELLSPLCAYFRALLLNK
jgi:hypothetical protein